MSSLAGIVEVILFNALGIWSFRRLTASRWRRRCGAERTFLAGWLVVFYAGRFAIDLLDFAPFVGPFFAASPLDSLIQRMDPARPWSSLGGFLLAELVPWVVLALVVLALVWLRSGRTLPTWIIAVLWVVVYFGYSPLIAALGLPDRFETGFASFHQAVLYRIGPWDISASALAAGALFSLLVLTAILLHLAGAVHRRARREFPRDTLAPYRMEGTGAFRAVFGYVLVLVGVAAGLGALIPLASDPNAIFLRSWLAFDALLALSTLCVTLLFQRLGGPEYLFQALALHRSRWQDGLLGLMASFLLVGLLTLAGQFLGWWRITGAREVSWGALGYAGVFLLDAVASELAFRGYVLQKLNTAIGFWHSVAIAALLQLPFCLLPPQAPWISVLSSFVAGLLAGALFWLSRSIWLPVAFRCGWNLALGPVFGHPIGRLACGQLFVLERVESAAWQSGGAFGPEGGVVSVAVLLLGLWMLRFHSWNEPRTSG
jgi:membrane protease YdiL (CAAX protease family)